MLSDIYRPYLWVPGEEDNESVAIDITTPQTMRDTFKQSDECEQLDRLFGPDHITEKQRRQNDHLRMLGFVSGVARCMQAQTKLERYLCYCGSYVALTQSLRVGRILKDDVQHLVYESMESLELSWNKLREIPDDRETMWMEVVVALWNDEPNHRRGFSQSLNHFFS